MAIETAPADVPARPNYAPRTPLVAKPIPGPRHQSAIPEIQLGPGDWFSFVKVYLARICKLVRIDWRVSVRKLRLLDTVLFELALTSQRIVTVVNSKGGSGKSPLATFMAALCQASFGDVVIVDVNENDGTTAKRLGIDRNKVQILLREAVANPTKIATMSVMKAKLGVHQETKLLCLPSDADSPAGSFSKRQLMQLEGSIKQDCHSIFNDTGNGRGHVANRAAVQMADILMVPILAGDSDSFDSAITTLKAYRSLGYGDLVRESLLVVSGTRSHHSKSRLLATLTAAALKTVDGDTTRAETLMEQLGITEANIFMIPYSRFIRRHNDVVTLNPRDIGIRTLVAMSQLAIALYSRPVALPQEKERRNHIAEQIQQDLAEEEAQARGERMPIFTPAT